MTDNIYKVYASAIEHTKSINKYFRKFNGINENGKVNRQYSFVQINDVFIFKYIYDIIIDIIERGTNDPKKYVNCKPFIDEYVDNFKKGYNDLMNDCPTNSITFKKDLFSAATNLYLPFHYDPDNNSLPDTWDTIGYNIGRFYEAWCLILKKQSTFESMFAPFFERVEHVLQTKYGTNPETEIVKLIELHNKTVQAKLIKPDLDSWLFWFAGVMPQSNNPQKIQWLKKRTDVMYFIYKLCPDLQHTNRKFPYINKVFAPIRGREFNSNDKPPTDGNKVTDLINTLF